MWGLLLAVSRWGYGTVIGQHHLEGGTSSRNFDTPGRAQERQASAAARAWVSGIPGEGLPLPLTVCLAQLETAPSSLCFSFCCQLKALELISSIAKRSGLGPAGNGVIPKHFGNRELEMLSQPLSSWRRQGGARDGGLATSR